MFPIGDGLAAARQAQGLSLADVENLTSIRVAQIEALEEERFDLFPGRAYARAFLRSYANALDLDADLFVDEFESRFVETAEPPPPSTPLLRRRPPWRPIAAAAFAALVVGYVAWTALSSGGDHGTVLPPTTSVASPKRAAAPARPARKRPSPTKRPAAPPRAAGVLVIRAVRGPCWIEARKAGPAGPVLYEQTLQQGESVRFSAPRVWLRFGAPWNIDATRGGKPIGGLTGSGALNRIA